MSNSQNLPEMPFFISKDPEDLPGNVYLLTLNVHDKCKIDTGEVRHFKNGKEVKIYKNWDTQTDTDIFYKSVVILSELLEDEDCLYTVCEKSNRNKTHVHALLYTKQSWHSMQLLQQAIHQEYVPKKLQYRTPLNACLDIKYLETRKDKAKVWVYMHKDMGKPWFQIDYIHPAPVYKDIPIPKDLIPAVERCYNCQNALSTADDKYEHPAWLGLDNLKFYYCRTCIKTQK